MKKSTCILLILLLVFISACGTSSSTASVSSSSSAASSSSVASSAASSSSSAAASSTAASGGKRVLRVAAESWEVTKIFLEDAEKSFEAAHPDVDVQIITYADTGVLSSYVLNWTQNATDVDLVFLDGGVAFAKGFDAKGLICDFENDLKIFSNYDSSKVASNALDYGRVNGKLVCFPIIQEVYGISCNVGMFKNAGLVDANGKPLAINSWDDFLEYAKKLTVKDSSGAITQQGGSIQFGNNLVTCIGAALIAQDGTALASDGISYNFDSDTCRNLLKNWQEGVVAGCYPVDTFADNSGGRNALKAGKLAMCYEAAGRWLEANNMLGDGTCIVQPVPGGKGTAGFACGVVVPKCSPNGDLAAQFITETLLGEYVQTNAFKKYGKMAVVTEYLNQVYKEVPTWSALSDSISKAKAVPNYNEAQKFSEGVCSILQAGLVDTKTTPDSMAKDLIALNSSISK